MNRSNPLRRTLLGSGAVLAGLAALPVWSQSEAFGAWASPLAAGVPLPDWPEIRRVLAGRAATRGRVDVALEAFAENGNSVPVVVTVQSPMLPSDYIQNVTLIPERNPRPLIARWQFSAASAQAKVELRIRLAGTQNVIALAEDSQGRWWWGSGHITVTASACLEGA